MCSLTSTPILLLLHSLTVRVACYRRVFDPFKIQLRISQSAGAGSVTSPATSPAKTNAKPAGKAQMTQGQEIRLLVPQIGVVMDSREFEVLTDVISNVGLAQVRKRKEKKSTGEYFSLVFDSGYYLRFVFLQFAVAYEHSHIAMQLCRHRTPPCFTFTFGASSSTAHSSLQGIQVLVCVFNCAA